MTTKRRQKRQIRKSRPPETIDHIRRQGTEKSILDFRQFQPITEQTFQKKKFSFNPSPPIDNNEEEFQPFTPSYHINGNNYQYIAFGKWADTPHRTSTIGYRNTYTTSYHPTNRQRNRYPIKYNPYPLINNNSQIERNKTTNRTKNLQTQAIVAPYRLKTDVKDDTKYNFDQSKPINNRTNGNEVEKFQSSTENINTNVRYPNIKDLLSDPDFDFEAFIKKFEFLTSTSTEHPKIDNAVSSTSNDNKSKISSTTNHFINITNVAVKTKIEENEKNNHKEAYNGTIQDKINDNKLNSKSNNSKQDGTELKTKAAEVIYNISQRPFVKANKLNESDYYYYDEYEDYVYPDKTKYNKNNDYSYYYDDEYVYHDVDIEKEEPSPEKIENESAIETFKINTGYRSSTTINPLSNSTFTNIINNKDAQESGTTPKTRRTTRRIPSRATRRPYTTKEQGGIYKGRQTTTQTYDNDTKSHHWKNSQR
ncbi:putative uncharacterized protein DDB_G0293878 [Diorhabda carinulata]|uniref:putative uncharacterized protein DDB_G0293878 n=1 Tax=Diorhabda carinulata TaxID=1163345 RepID=UPI0025A1504C|nr:putative uncharacterized protein DDB_G0293878 [Diorhabda carinulata]